MRCTNCKKDTGGAQKFCPHCGMPFLNEKNFQTSQSSQVNLETIKHTDAAAPTQNPPPKPLSIFKLVRNIAIASFFGLGLISNLIDNAAIDLNDKAIDSFNSGNIEAGIQELEQAYEKATTNDVKINILKNLGYLHLNNNNQEKSLENFEKALAISDANSIDHYLITGEIAYLKNTPAEAEKSYQQALVLNPFDPQINNALALLYIDFEGLYPEFTNYEKAIEYGKKAVTHSDDGLKSTTTSNLATAYFLNENYDDSIAAILTLDINQAPLLPYLLGLNYWNLNDNDTAKIYFEMAKNAGYILEPEVEEFLNPQK